MICTSSAFHSFGACRPDHSSIANEGAISWWQLGIVVLAAVLGSHVLAAIFDRVIGRRHARHDTAQGYGSDVLTALGKLRVLYQSWSASMIVVDPARDQQAYNLESKLLVAAAKTGEPLLMSAADDYIAVGQRWAASDPSVNPDAERAAFFSVLRAAAHFMRANR